MRDFSELNAAIKAGRERAKRLRDEAAELANRPGAEDLTAGESQRFDRLRRGWEAAEKEVQDAQDEYRDNLRAHVANSGGRGMESGGGGSSAEFMKRVNPDDDSFAVRDRARSILDDRRGDAAHLDDAQRAKLDATLASKGTDSLDVGYLAERMLITESPEYRSAWQQVVTAGETTMLDHDEIKALRRFAAFEQHHSRAMNEGAGNAGLFGVPVLIDPTVILSAQGTADFAELLGVCRVEQISTKEWNGVSSAGVTWSFDAEGSEVSDDSPTLAQPNVPTHMARGFVPFSIELGMDYPGFANEMSRLLLEGYHELVTNKLTVGSGTGEPRGIVTALAANTNVEVTVTTAGSLGAVDVYKLWDALPNRFRNGASWMSSVNVENGVRQLGSGSVDSAANFSINITQNSVDMLFGKRYVKNDWMSDLVSGTNAGNLLVVGNFQNLVVAQRVGMQVETVQHLFHVSNNRPSGQRGLFAYARIGSDSVNDAAFRMLINKTS